MTVRDRSEYQPFQWGAEDRQELFSTRAELQIQGIRSGLLDIGDLRSGDINRLYAAFLLVQEGFFVLDPTMPGFLTSTHVPVQEEL